jgi:hypothetical protein
MGKRSGADPAIAGEPGLLAYSTMPAMNEHQIILEEELAEAWYELYTAHIDSRARGPARRCTRRWEALIEALGAYDRVLQRMKQKDNNEAGGD